MLFALRGAMVGLAFFGVVYCLLSVLVVIVWQGARLLRRNTGYSSARSLFALRVFPLVGAAFVTIVFALPAFFLLEGGMDEDLGTVIFSAGTLLLFAAGLVRVVTAQAGALRVREQWLRRSKALDNWVEAPTLRVPASAPPLLLCGISTPKILVSEAAIALLSPEELRVAIGHEVGHLGSRDNLKKLIQHGIPFPGMASLEHSWQAMAELEADASAVSSCSDALNLASALIKLCDIAPMNEPPAFTTGFAGLTSLVKVRVQRLLAWNEGIGHSRTTSWQWSLPGLFLLAYGAANYSHALLLTHRLTEWFIH